MKLRLMNRKCLKINELLFWHSISTVQNNKQLKIFLLNKVTAKASSMLIINICTLCYMHWHKTKPCLGYFPISPWISAFLGTVSSLILLFVTNKALLSTMGPRLEDFIFVGYWCKFWFLLLWIFKIWGTVKNYTNVLIYRCEILTTAEMVRCHYYGYLFMGEVSYCNQTL